MSAMLGSAATVDITPTWPVPLGGDPDRQGHSRSVHDPLEANVLVLHDEGRTVALVSCDLLYVGRAIREGVERRFAHRLGPESLFLGSSHTHFAPMTQHSVPRLGRVDDRYVEQCIDRISDALEGAMGRLVPVRLSFHRGTAPEGTTVNRRLKRLRLGRAGLSWRAGFAPNPGGAVDRTIRGLRVEDEEGDPVATLWNFACHPTAHPVGSDVTAEYPGRVRAALREASRTRQPVLFFQGFTGDIRPPFRSRVTGWRSALRRVLFGPSFGTATVEEHRAWADRLGGSVVETMTRGGRILTPAIGGGRAAFDLAEVADCPRGAKSIVAHVVQLAGDLVLVGLSCEAVIGLQRIVQTVMGARDVIPVGYIDDVPCYLPMDAALREGGYEVSEFRRSFSMDGAFRGGIDAAVEDLVRSALSRAVEGRRTTSITEAGVGVEAGR